MHDQDSFTCELSFDTCNCSYICLAMRLGYYSSIFNNLLVVQGSKAQLEQVWEETDGLDANDFEPRTFFKLHGKY